MKKSFTKIIYEKIIPEKLYNKIQYILIWNFTKKTN